MGTLLRYLVLIISIFVVVSDFRISDDEGDILSISSSGELIISQVNDSLAGGTSTTRDVRISDNDGDVVEISIQPSPPPIGGTVNVQWA